jgi:hypothetical protein
MHEGLVVQYGDNCMYHRMVYEWSESFEKKTDESSWRAFWAVIDCNRVELEIRSISVIRHSWRVSIDETAFQMSISHGRKGYERSTENILFWKDQKSCGLLDETHGKVRRLLCKVTHAKVMRGKFCQDIMFLLIYGFGPHGSVVGWDTMLQAIRLRDRVPMR